MLSGTVMPLRKQDIICPFSSSNCQLRSQEFNFLNVILSRNLSFGLSSTAETFKSLGSENFGKSNNNNEKLLGNFILDFTFPNISYNLHSGISGEISFNHILFTQQLLIKFECKKTKKI